MHPQDLKVLNAFRHQRFDTITNRHFRLTLLCAQRLSASEIRHLKYLICKSFSISMCSTPFGIRDSTRNQSVLNIIAIYCAQRLSASEIRHDIPDSSRAGSGRCSTPFGIRDSTLISQCNLSSIRWCSTPFGIRDSTHE